ncbi:MAG: GTPase Era [Ignavibacteria bacterium GWF2_33_9]|nr:MAG: GTPase Era [Ignavibacteria bacterium GWF2_33_9]
MAKKSGFIAILGKPNAGKSTLMNALLGTNLSIVTPKPQTTRKEVIGILTEKDYQIIFLDTPGIIKPKYKLQEAMMETIPQAMQSADVLLVLLEVDSVKKQHPLHSETLALLQNTKLPKIAILSKIDTCKSTVEIIPLLEKIQKMDLFDEIIPLSAKEKVNLEPVVSSILNYLPEHEFYYDEESLSTQNNKFFVSEIIREQVFLLTEEEIPFSTEVQISEFYERERGKWFIGAEIIVEKKTQKQIIIGKSGSLIKQIGLQARFKIEELLEHEVYLELFVKVRQDWRNNPSQLKAFGY